MRIATQPIILRRIRNETHLTLGKSKRGEMQHHLSHTLVILVMEPGEGVFFGPIVKFEAVEDAGLVFVYFEGFQIRSECEEGYFDCFYHD